jgi:hypothetical protein
VPQNNLMQNFPRNMEYHVAVIGKSGVVVAWSKYSGYFLWHGVGPALKWENRAEYKVLCDKAIAKFRSRRRKRFNV